MLKFLIYILTCILVGMAKSEYNSTECGPFIHEALHPIRHRIANLREQVKGQTAALSKTLTDMERILNAIDEAKEKLDGIQAKLEGNPEPDTPGFERIGSRYFFIEHEDRKSWTGAEIACRQKGGYLAAFQNQEEFDGIKEKLQIAVYWLGINQKIKEGDFVSVASGKPATFLNWMLDEPFNYDDIKEDCVLLVLGQMSTRQCDLGFHFICQLDNKV